MRRIAALAVATLLVATATLSAPGPAAGLDLGQWVQNPATGHWYAEAAPMAWPDAEAWAVGLGGHLVSINNQAEETWLETTFPDPLWIGLNDVAVEGSWVWSSGEPVTYTYWIPGQPDNWIDVGGEDYAVMNWTFNDAFGWDDFDGNSMGSIIEVVNPPSTGTLTVTTSTTLTADHFGNIVIASDGVTLDCAGHSVKGAGVGSGILLDERSGVTVKNCAVTGFERGFELIEATGNRLEHNTATHNYASYGQGFFLTFGSNANILERNTANENGVVGDPASGMEGFRIQDSRDNVLHDNVANLNASWGFIVVGYDADASGNMLDGNTANDNAYFGFSLATRAVGNTLTGNTADGNGNTGFLVEANDGSNTFRNNRAANNRYNGFNDSNSPSNTFVGNVADHNGATGFAADGTSGLVFTHNIASNSLDGFVILLVDSSRFVMNTADHNLRNGFAALNSASDVFSRNVVKGNRENGNGFVFLGSSDLWVENNAAEDVFGACFSLGSFDGPGTSATTLVGNTAARCRSGFGLDLATANTLKGNKATNGNPGGEGFALGPSAELNVLSGNVAIDNDDGFKLWSQGNGGASHNLLTGNIANRNAKSGFLVQEDASYNSFVRNFAHGNGEWDALQATNAGPGNLWIGNRFGVAAGF